MYDSELLTQIIHALDHFGSDFILHGQREPLARFEPTRLEVNAARRDERTLLAHEHDVVGVN